MRPLPSPARSWLAFRFLATVFCLALGRERLLLIPPLAPAALRQAILRLGVCYVKLSQVLATRADYFPGEYLTELRRVHDRTEPMSDAAFRTVCARAFAHTPPFKTFCDEPIASASIGQVHRAELPDGQIVAVKLRRLGVRSQVARDIRLLRALLGLFRPLFNPNTRNSIETVIAEFSAMILKETDFVQEAANIAAFQRLYGDTGVVFPRVYGPWSGADALVMSFEHGARIDDVAGLEAMGVSGEAVMDLLIDFYTEQMLITGLFHADPHPGNILVREGPTLVFLDFGMVKRLAGTTRRAMIELVRAAHEEDFERFEGACRRLGIVTPQADSAQVQEFAWRMMSIFAAEELTARSMQTLALQVLCDLRASPFKLPQEIIFVMRASALVEGLGTHFIPNFNGVKDILPALKRNLGRALGPRHGVTKAALHEAAELPITLTRVKRAVDQIADQNLEVRLSRETVDQLRTAMGELLRPLALGAVCVLGSFFVLLLPDFPLREVTAGVLFAVGVVRIALSLR